MQNGTDDYIAKGIDVLVIDPVEKEAMVPAFERLKDAGIPVVCVDRYVPAEYESVVKADDVKIGKKAGEAMVKLLGGTGKVVEIQGRRLLPIQTTGILASRRASKDPILK
ncbi:MAG: substrate-binding domain-containing protein [Christensenella sp.]|nr:substrate-binding domain-containing protein [Christensenella sp.]MEA5003353.1 substrate-binding domain-containing protein [Christensenella sp.]